jgi:hypothetical protein
VVDIPILLQACYLGLYLEVVEVVAVDLVIVVVVALVDLVAEAVAVAVLAVAGNQILPKNHSNNLSKK